MFYLLLELEELYRDTFNETQISRNGSHDNSKLTQNTINAKNITQKK